jgi:FKBP-type peptidyl-prolyl cis-trans isomerase SlpA
MKRADFNAEIELSEGLIVSFMDPKKREMVGIVRRLVGEVVEVDLNHPLSGRDLIFDVDIKAIEQISNEILRA